jgi:rubrerythrin
MNEPLTEAQKKLLSLFKVAIEDERKAQESYKEILALCTDSSLRSIIESFILEEKNHEEALLIKYGELRKADAFKDEA